MTSANTRVNDLVVNVMTEEQFEKITPQDNQLYLTPDEDQEWQKPADWIDIRSGAIDNSIYFLVGHSVDYSTYNLFPISCKVSNSGTFDVFIDGCKIATASTDYHINWQELALDTGFDITYPETLRAHIVRITPTLNTNKFTEVRAIYTGTGYTDVGLLWAHFEIDYEISLYMFASTFSTQRAGKLEAITAKGDLLKTSSCYHSFYRCYSLKKTPVFDCTNASSATGFFADCGSIKNIKLKNFTATSAGSLFAGCVSLSKIESEGSKFSPSNAFNTCYSLQQIPPLLIDNTEILDFSMGSGLKDTYLDLSQYTKTKRLNATGAANRKMLGLKSVTVSNEAPFNNSKSPQIDVRHTGLSRAALVNLFKSMPYNVGYEVIGSPTINNGLLSVSSNADIVSASATLTYNYNSNIEFYARFKTEDTVNTTRRIIGKNNTTGRNVIWTDVNSVYCLTPDGAGFNPLSWYQLQADTWYRVKVTGNNGTWTIGIYDDNGTLIKDNTKQLTSGTEQSFIPVFNSYYGNNSPQKYLDLNNTYIKVNGIPWFGPGVTKNLVPGGTVVGSPTITNGIASGFSSSNYISASNFSTSSPLEMVIRTKYNTFTSGTRYLFSFAGFYILQDSANSMYCSIQKSDETIVYPSFGPELLPDTYYYLKCVYDGTTLWTGISTDGITYTETYNQPLTLYSRIGTATLGYRNSATTVWDGSIDLNNTYIKVNGTKVFSGMVPMTKTCSIVGCTGTADLTQEDKNIALDKGWELTVA